MITKRITTEQILANLKAKVDARIPIMISSAGSGLVAKLQEVAGSDCINTFSGARLRANGMGTMSMMWPILDSNKQTLDYTREDIMPALSGKSFVCACLNANDPLKDMRMVLQQCKDMGVQSVSNIGPSVSYVDHDSEIFKVITSAGITIQNEIDMLILAKEEMDMVSVGLAFTEEDSYAICEQAKPHIFCYPRRHNQRWHQRLRQRHDNRRDGRANRKGLSKVSRAKPRYHSRGSWCCHGNSIRRPIHAQQYQRARLLDRILYRTSPYRTSRLSSSRRIPWAEL